MRREETITDCMRVKQYRSLQRAVPRVRRLVSAPDKRVLFSHEFCLNKVPDNILPPSHLSFSPAIFPFSL
jgi:hypothetical protein